MGVPSVIYFLLSAVGSLLVVAGIIPTFFAVTGLTGAPILLRGGRRDPDAVRSGLRGDDPTHSNCPCLLRLYPLGLGPSGRRGWHLS
jgi:hypothetical protein